ncbi:MAG: c-type cytochrome, partial [Verrucomicrobiae bacterium]|nr:c-type cytochrome [Verrucomicrobiae bacterium]
MKSVPILFGVFLTLMPPAAPAADIERGKTIYSQICFNCHGPHLDGGQGPALKDQYWQHGSSPEAI